MNLFLECTKHLPSKTHYTLGFAKHCVNKLPGEHVIPVEYLDAYSYGTPLRTKIDRTSSNAFL